MSSSQGANTSEITPGYAFDTSVIRDSSDWTRYVKEQRVFKATKPLQTEDPWIPYGNGYRLTFLTGKFKCGSCTGNAFSGNGLQLPAPSS